MIYKQVKNTTGNIKPNKTYNKNLVKKVWFSYAAKKEARKIAIYGICEYII